MTVSELIQYLEKLPKDGNVLIYTAKENEDRLLLLGDLDFDGKNLVIDAEYHAKQEAK